MRTLPTLTGLLVAPLLSIACSGDLPTEADNTSTPTPQFSAHAGNRVVESVRGSGHFTASFFEELEDGWRNFSFNAKKHADGSVSGQMQYKNRESGVTYHGDVVCLEETVNDIYVITTEDKKVTEGFPGVFPLLGESVWLVRDNGQGANDPPDELSFTFAAPPPVGVLICEDVLAFFTEQDLEDALMPIEAGNITVTKKD